MKLGTRVHIQYVRMESALIVRLDRCKEYTEPEHKATGSFTAYPGSNQEARARHRTGCAGGMGDVQRKQQILGIQRSLDFACRQLIKQNTNEQHCVP